MKCVKSLEVSEAAKVMPHDLSVPSQSVFSVTFTLDVARKFQVELLNAILILLYKN